MTEKLYYSSVYTKTWSTKIEQIWEQNNKFFVTLEKTCFYPEGGGQPSDTGTIDGIAVIDVQISENKIVHQLERNILQKEVECKLNWQIRYDHMQQHTGQHLLSAVIHDLYGIPTVSFHLGKDYTSIDLDIHDLSPEHIVEIENKCNTYITENKKITTYFVTDEELKQIPLRKIPDVTAPIRIVEIEEIDYSACAGTHVKRTGELGLLKLLKTEKHRGQIRLFFLVGFRALTDYQLSHLLLNEICDHYRTNKHLLLGRILKQEQEKKQMEKEMEKLMKENIKFFIKSIMTKQNSQLVAAEFEDKSLKELQLAAKEILKENNCIVLFSTHLENRVLLQHNGNFDFQCGELIKKYVHAFNGKGGGNKVQAQILFSSTEEMDAFTDKIKKDLHASFLSHS
ncbi:alanyl-tRNA editing protein [Niallia sp. 03133]|uniref:alanyl-tRNA editing protein n=1 Tax=Niallia sp. 03133 TaxID=3458060 RepID=UPI004043A6A4